MFGYGVFAQLTFAQAPGDGAPTPIIQNLTAGLVFGASLSRQVSKLLFAGVVFEASLSRAIAIFLQAGLEFSASLTRTSGRYLAAGLTFAATLIATYIPFPPIGTAYEWLIRARRRGRR